MSAEASTKHVEQGIPFEWRAFRVGDKRIIAHDVPEETVDCYRAARWTYNPRVMVRADALLYDGMVVEPFWGEQYRSVLLQHCFAGKIDRLKVDEMVSEPVVVLERCELINPETTRFASLEENQ